MDNESTDQRSAQPTWQVVKETIKKSIDKLVGEVPFEPEAKEDLRAEPQRSVVPIDAEAGKEEEAAQVIQPGDDLAAEPQRSVGDTAHQWSVQPIEVPPLPKRWQPKQYLQRD